MARRRQGISVQEQAVIDRIAHEFGVKAEAEGSGVRLVVAGSPVALVFGEIAAGQPPVARPQLRFDKVVVRVTARLKAALLESVPPGETVIVTITAPVRQPGRTAAELAGRIGDALERGGKPVGFDGTVHGNRISVRQLCAGPASAGSVVVFVHNPETEAAALLDRTAALLRCLAGEPEGESWLVLTSEEGRAYAEAWRHACEQVLLPAAVAKVILVAGDGGVETLTPSEA